MAKPQMYVLPYEEKKAIAHCLAGSDSPSRDLVVQLVDRIEMVDQTTYLNVTKESTSYVEAALMVEVSKARIEAYRYAIMVACKLQKEVDDAVFLRAINAPNSTATG